MQVFSELFKSAVGMASLATIVIIILIAIFLFFWVKRRVDSDSKSQNKQ